MIGSCMNNTCFRNQRKCCKNSRIVLDLLQLPRQQPATEMMPTYLAVLVPYNQV